MSDQYKWKDRHFFSQFLWFVVQLLKAFSTRSTAFKLLLLGFEYVHVRIHVNPVHMYAIVLRCFSKTIQCILLYFNCCRNKSGWLTDFWLNYKATNSVMPVNDCAWQNKTRWQMIFYNICTPILHRTGFNLSRGCLQCIVFSYLWLLPLSSLLPFLLHPSASPAWEASIFLNFSRLDFNQKCLAQNAILFWNHAILYSVENQVPLIKFSIFTFITFSYPVSLS